MSQTVTTITFNTYGEFCLRRPVVIHTLLHAELYFIILTTVLNLTYKHLLSSNHVNVNINLMDLYNSALYEKTPLMITSGYGKN